MSRAQVLAVRRVGGRRRRRLTAVMLAAVLTTVGAVAAFAASPPPADGYFALTAPGTAFKTEQQCAAEVHRSPWEPRPQNAGNNVATPQPVTLNNSPDFKAAWNTSYRTRITGNFTGTTDEIIQWAACKWGWSDEIIRAQAMNESTWDQDVLGDYEARSRGHCTSEFPTGTTCPTSFGLLQVKWYYHPGPYEGPGGSYPLARRYTAFNVDYALAEIRGCYDGLSSYLGAQTRGDVWGCLGAWYSGAWRDSGALSYIDRVQRFLAEKAWRTWPDQSGGTTPPTAPPTTATPTSTTKAPTTTIAPTTTVPAPTSTTIPSAGQFIANLGAQIDAYCARAPDC